MYSTKTKTKGKREHVGCRPLCQSPSLLPSRLIVTDYCHHPLTSLYSPLPTPHGMAWVNQNVGWVVSYWENPTDQQRVHSHCSGRSERQFCPDEDGFLAALPQELVVMGYATQEALQLGTDVLQRLLNTESSLPDSECCQGARHTQEY